MFQYATHCALDGTKRSFVKSGIIDFFALAALNKRMRMVLLTCLLWTGALVALPAPGWAQDRSVDAADREIIERLDRMETQLDGLDTRLVRVETRMEGLEESIKQLREDLNSQLDRHFQLILGVLAAFTFMFVSILGFAVWDRRTMLRPVVDKVKSLEEDLSTKGRRLDVILDALRSLGQRDERVAAILKRLHLL